MVKLSYEVFRKGIAMLAAIPSYRSAATPEMLEVYYAALKDMTDRQFQAAVERILKTRAYTTFPVPADFRADPTADDIAMVALSILRDAIRSYGSYQSVEFADPVLTAVVVSLGGWIAVCDIDWSDTYQRHQFTETYAAFSRQGVERQGHLPGLHENQNIGLPGWKPTIRQIAGHSSAQKSLVFGQD